MESLSPKQLGEIQSLYESVYESEEVVHITEEQYKECLEDVITIALVESGLLDIEFENEELLEKILVQEGLMNFVSKAGQYIAKNPKKAAAIGTGLLGLDQIRQDGRKDFLSGKRFVDLRSALSGIKGFGNYMAGRKAIVRSGGEGTGDQVVDVSGSNIEDSIKTSDGKTTTKYIDKFLKDKEKKLRKEFK